MAEIDAERTPASGAHTPPAAGPVRLLQFTDLHLFADPHRRLLGQDTRATFESVVALARSRHWPPDALLLTGDLVHDEVTAGYRLLRERLAALGIPYFCIPGNHDRLDLLVGHLDSGAASAMRVVAMGAWDLVLLDSTIPGEAGGHLDASVLRGLAEHGAASGRPTMVFLHHHPLPVQSRWIDTMRVDNGTELLETLRQHPQLRAVVFGHIHQGFEQAWSDSRLIGTPSTCVQFHPRSRDFQLDSATPGYRWIDLYPDGQFETGIERTDTYPEPLDLAEIDGY